MLLKESVREMSSYGPAHSALQLVLTHSPSGDLSLWYEHLEGLAITGRADDALWACDVKRREREKKNEHKREREIGLDETCW
eukprot:CAMPEP_0182438638 /NCGR_PEP_ID=MMETSP1167-20130531/85912_1 /TAXON_ID=2988 /ORGANISM="Mallomonas Sp, Strain CCMP3275" /LENGTH=81 /DNA_ID=CAMNT_0024632087 /DNA_START=36 /DNA_END=278 /DNA_ORIENTATION=-